MKNVLFVISGPSGVGKGTVAKIIAQTDPNVALSVSCTTRLPRKGETDGKEYFFLSKQAFENKIASGGFLEYSEHFDNYYGTEREFVTERLKTCDVLLEIDVNGGLNVKNNFPDAVLIMLVPPSVEELKNRLIKRNTEDAEKIEKRLSRMQYELAKRELYDYVVVNDSLDRAVEEIRQILLHEKNK